MDVNTYKRLNVLVGKYCRQVTTPLEFSELHQILDSAIERIDAVELTEVLYHDDFQLSLENQLNKA